ncbi:MAG: MMPL family transporter, partial [Firmicutes bacterium]|nr:MMPL family transporter [Bacillota bacterium]
MTRWIKMVLDRPWVVIALVLVITVITGSFLTRLEFDASIDTMIPMDDPILAEQQGVADEFGSQELFLIAIQSENVFSPATLRKIGEMAELIEAVPGVEKVTSPLNAQMVESGFFGIEIGPMTTSLPQTPDEIGEFKANILDSPYLNRLITEDGRGAALLLDLENHNGDSGSLVEQIQAILEQYEGPEEIHIVGDSYIMHYTEMAMKQDLRNLVPFVVLVIAIVLYFTFRSMLGVFIPLVTVGASLIWTVGLMAWWGIPVSIISMVMPVILVTLGIASSIHILNKYQESLAQGLEKRAALEETFATITSPVAMAALTTAAGFASLVTAFVHPIREFGVLTAIGVMLAMGLSLSLIPALLMLFKEPRPQETREEKGFLTRVLSTLNQVSIDHPWRVTAVVVLLVVVFGYGSSHLTLESNIVNYFSQSSPVRKGAQIIEDIFGGSMQISVVVDTG